MAVLARTELSAMGLRILQNLRLKPRQAFFKSSSNLNEVLMSKQFVVHPEVKEALHGHQPIVALETAIVTHGMPHPHNYEVAKSVEDIVRRNGAVPATIGLVDGCIHVGLSSLELQQLADPDVRKVKVSRRDFPFALSQGLSGGTTVAGSIMVAHKCAIPMFVTGGIGGVHRGGETSMDVSADVIELGRSPVAVVCAGAKSILDIGRTLEVLETQGVAVVTLGESAEFPAFFTPLSGYKSPYCVSTVEQCAELIHQANLLSNESGVLVAVPIPDHAAKLGMEIEDAIQEALVEANHSNIQGRDITPFVLEQVNKKTEGKSLQANIALVQNNAEIGSQISVLLNNIKGEHVSKHYDTVDQRQWYPIATTTSKKGSPVVIGSSIVDFTAKTTNKKIWHDGTNPGSLRTTLGGVGRNLAEGLARLGMDPIFITAVGKDEHGERIINNFKQLGIGMGGVLVADDIPTAQYCVVLDGTGEMYCGIGDMEINSFITPELIHQSREAIERAPIVLLDANITGESMRALCDLCQETKTPILHESTCAEKCAKFVKWNLQDRMAYLTPNFAELLHIHLALTGEDLEEKKDTSELSREEKMALSMKYLPDVLAHCPYVLVKLGVDGVLLGRRDPHSGSAVSIHHYPPAPECLLPVTVASVTGAGDSFVCGFVSSLVSEYSVDLAVKTGLRCAHLSLQSNMAISDQINPALIHQSHPTIWKSLNSVRLV